MVHLNDARIFHFRIPTVDFDVPVEQEANGAVLKQAIEHIDDTLLKKERVLSKRQSNDTLEDFYIPG